MGNAKKGSKAVILQQVLLQTSTGEQRVRFEKGVQLDLSVDEFASKGE